MRNSSLRSLAPALLALPLAFSAAPARAADADEIKLLREQLRALEQKLLVLERQQEIRQEAADTAAKTAPVIAAGAGGFSLTSADRGFQLRIRANLHADARFFISDNVEGNDTFLIRRLRPSFEGTLGEKFGFRLMPDLAPATFQLLDAYATYAHSPALNFLVGKTKTPFDLERLVSQTDLLFIERAYPTSLGPNRDLGVQVFGDVLGGKLTYQAAWQNGVADGGSSVTDSDDEKEVAVRVFAHPFKDSFSALAGLGVGVAVSVGDKDTGAPAVYRTNAQQTFFSWAGGVASAGRHTRVSPQAYYYHGPLGLIGSWTSSQQELSRAGQTREVETTAWFAAAHYVLTGEDTGIRGVTPQTNFSWKDGTWGAFEVAARYGVLAVEDAAFAGTSATWFANPATSAREARGTTLGLNWYLNRNVKFTLNLEHTDFVGGDAGALTREDEQAVFTRVQLRY
ncbi:MAG: porin [Opitutus sp.]|nr:porin [Opitutus sp.]